MIPVREKYHIFILNLILSVVSGLGAGFRYKEVNNIIHKSNQVRMKNLTQVMWHGCLQIFNYHFFPEKFMYSSF